MQLEQISRNNHVITVQLGNGGYDRLQLHQHKRLTRAQSHHCSDEERKKRKILARKVGSKRFTQQGTVTPFSQLIFCFCSEVQTAGL